VSDELPSHRSAGHMQMDLVHMTRVWQNVGYIRPTTMSNVNP